MTKTDLSNQKISLIAVITGIIAIIGSWFSQIQLISVILAGLALILSIFAYFKKHDQLASAAAAVAVVACIVAGYQFYTKSSDSMIVGENLNTEIHIKGLDVSNGQLEASGSSARVNGVVSNHTGKGVKQPIVNYNAYNSKKELIGSCVDAMYGELAAGESWSFSAVCDTSELPTRVELVGATTPTSYKE